MITDRGVARKIYFAVPGSKYYESEYYKNSPNSFANISITGTKCSCRCAHCHGKLLESMIQTVSLEEFYTVIDGLVDKGCQGVLVSGGCNDNGEVPLAPFASGIAYARKKGLKVLAHCGIISKSTAYVLKEAGVNQVLMDIIGDESTIRAIYHLDRQPQDYYEAMMNCREFGLDFVPHVVMGLNYGKIKGEYRALEMIRKAEADVVVLVVFRPMRGTPMEYIDPLPVAEAALIVKHSRTMFPTSLLNLGCAKPAGMYKEELEKTAIDSGVDAIAFPSDKTIEYAQSKGLVIIYKEECCSMCVR